MIAGIFHQGSGLGNQLHRYVMTRVLAEDKGYEWGMIHPNQFKGFEFMHIDLGKAWARDKNNWQEWQEKKVIENGIDIRGYDPEINFIQDDTIIDGEFQDERYFEHRLDDIRDWLAVEPLYMRPDICVIGFRGGEYTMFSDLYLPASYWETAIQVIKLNNSNMLYEVHTDDVVSAEKMLAPIFERLHIQKVKYIHDIGLNWRSVRYAKYLIIANSSFYIFPALLNQDLKFKVIAPRFWARPYSATWALPQNYYKKFLYT